MGIKTAIRHEQLPPHYQHHQLLSTTDGVMASVYLLDDQYILKLFEEDVSTETVEQEIVLLNQLEPLSIPKVIEHFKIKNHQVVITTQIEGKSLENPSTHEIEQIGVFLKLFHQKSKQLTSSNKNLFTTKRLGKLIELTQQRIFQEYFQNLNIELKEEGIIHGDLFVDNAKFKNGKLSGVYDFTDACSGDFHFELAVVAISWCYNKKMLNPQKVMSLLKSYGSSMELKAFNEYIRYALLYYATTRYLNHKNYQELLDRLDKLL
ncbi:MAG TPA: hypothetical protein EYG67_00820 [Campylobacterales bacterium]|nr:hypothetical protein [Campylobacterales bacterium]HIP41426.1 hypothetical protein [Campylobacterales bacterium]